MLKYVSKVLNYLFFKNIAFNFYWIGDLMKKKIQEKLKGKKNQQQDFFGFYYFIFSFYLGSCASTTDLLFVPN